MPAGWNRFFQELKRRNVYRVATVYAITGWIIVEVTDTVFPHLGLPEWLVTALVVVILAGFPVALILSWIYDIGPEGFIKTDKEESSQNSPSTSGKKPFTSNLLIVILAILLVGQFIYFGIIRNSWTGGLSEEIREEKVAVAVFNNETGKEDLEAFGKMASEWITAGLRELDVQASSPEMMRKCQENVGILPGNPGNLISLFELTGARYVVTGSFYLEDSILQVTSRLESTETGDVVYDFPLISGPVKDKEVLIQEIRDRLKGYWAVKQVDRLDSFEPPKYEAYQALMECDGVPWDHRCQRNAVRLDSSFMLARVYLYFSTFQWELEEENQQTRQYILDNWDICTPYEKSYFRFVENMSVIRYEDALKALEENLSLDSHDLSVLLLTAQFYHGLNQSEKALDLLGPLFEDYSKYREKFVIQEFYSFYFGILLSLGNSREIKEFISELDAKDYRKMGVKGRYQVFRALLLEGDFNEIDRLQDFYRDQGIPWDVVNWAYAHNSIFPDDTLNYFETQLRERLDEFKDPQDTWDYGISTQFFHNNHQSRAFAHYVLREFEEAEAILLDLRTVDWENYFTGGWTRKFHWHTRLWVEGFLGSTLARQGRTEEALAQAEYLESMRINQPHMVNRLKKGSISYYQARIYAILGMKQEAVEALSRSIQEGKINEFRSFDQDWDLAALSDFQPYRDLIEQK